MAATPESLWEVRRIPNKGYGVVATAPIEPGTRLLMEEPLYIRSMTDDSIQQQNSIVESLIQSLPDAAQRDAFHALASSFSVLYPELPYYSIATTNEVALSGAQNGASGLFLRWSRFNHACTPSAYWAWNSDGTSPKGRAGVLTVHAIRRLNPGDEISISYFENRVMPHEDRERYLAEIYCFACDCALCSLAPGPWRDDVDERLRQLEAFWRKYHLGEEIQDRPSSPLLSPQLSSCFYFHFVRRHSYHHYYFEAQRYRHDPAGCLAECREAAELILEAEEDVGDGAGGEDGDIAGCIDVTFAYEIALALALFVGDAARASVFAARNRDRYTVTLGADSGEALRAGRGALDPCADRSFGLGLGGGRRRGMGLGSEGVVVPDVEEIGEEAFEEWLWSAEEWELGG
ncbi:SET domain-containing protein [Apiospora marii]|uniref:SET domain-containing protein n=1 Tax=Apiospora marii TaxID=335849 RepID=A0ABR1T3T8_9PEZI